MSKEHSEVVDKSNARNEILKIGGVGDVCTLPEVVLTFDNPIE